MIAKRRLCQTSCIPYSGGDYNIINQRSNKKSRRKVTLLFAIFHHDFVILYDVKCNYSGKDNYVDDKKEETRGHIAFYLLQDWWLTTFSEAEKKYIEEEYEGRGLGGRNLIREWIWKINGKESGERDNDAGFFLYTLASYFRSKTDISIYERIQEKVAELGVSRPLYGLGYVRGRYYITYVYDVEKLKRQNRLDEAEALLLELIEADESVRREEKNRPPAPWYYEHLAIVYRKNKKYSEEVFIIERYLNQSDGGSIHHPKMLKRLEKAKKLSLEHS